MKIHNITLSSILLLALMSFTLLKNAEKKDSSSTENFIITHGSVGPFALKAAFPGEGEYRGYNLVKKEQTRYAEDGASKEVVFHAQKDGVTHIIIHPQSDNDALIGELEVISALYETKAGVGVGSSLYDFYSYYPDGKAYYTFISGMYWVEHPAVMSAQFLIDETACLTQPDDSGDLTILKKSSLNMKSRIQSIRIY